MRLQIFVAVFLVFIFGAQNVFMFLLPGNPGIIGTALKPKCNKYIGKVECENGRQILPTAKVSLMEFKRSGMYAVVSKERITHNGAYLIVGCIEDGHSDHLYLKFKDACYRGQEYIPVQKPNIFKTHRLGGEMPNNLTYDAATHDSNSSMPHFRRRLKYPPQPRPRHPRHHRKMEIGTGVESKRGRIGTALNPGCYKFSGKVECQNGRRILPTAKVTVLEFDNVGLNDRISRAMLNRNGTYQFIACPEDVSMAHLFLEFEDVCFFGQRYQAGRTSPNTFESRRLNGNLQNAWEK